MSSRLLEGVKAFDPEAWRRLAYLYGPLVYGWCRRQGLQASDCEDVVQEVFLTVVVRVADFQRQRTGGTFRGWLWAITRHKLGDWIRRAKAREKPLGDRAQPSTALETPSAEAEEPAGPSAPGKVGSLYRRALELIRPEFEDQSWETFCRVVLQGQKAADVAADLGLTRNAVYIAKSRILNRLREVLGED
jgi:RNA polymerase sigma-70 factor (ECF subfamily)